MFQLLLIHIVVGCNISSLNINDQQEINRIQIQALESVCYEFLTQDYKILTITYIDYIQQSTILTQKTKAEYLECLNSVTNSTQQYVQNHLQIAFHSYLVKEGLTENQLSKDDFKMHCKLFILVQEKQHSQNTTNP